MAVPSWVRKQWPLYRTKKQSKAPTIITDTDRIDAIELLPAVPEQRASKYDINGRVMTPDGWGRLVDYYRADDGDVYMDVRLEKSRKVKRYVSINVASELYFQEAERNDQIERAKKRAKAAGFRTDVVFYHGSNAHPFKAFNPAYRGHRDSGWFGLGYYFTPVLASARGYGTPRAFFLKYSKPFRIKDENINNLRPLFGGLDHHEWEKWLTDRGFDAVERWVTVNGKKWMNEVVLFDRTRIRDVNAKFKNLKSHDLMA